MNFKNKLLIKIYLLNNKNKFIKIKYYIYNFNNKN